MRRAAIYTTIITICCLSSCKKKEACISCIAQDASGTITDHRVACDKDGSYLSGFEDGFKQKAKKNNQTASCAKDE